MSRPNLKDSIDLGLAILSSVEHRLPEGARRSQDEIAAYCECSKTRIQQIEERALRKMRMGLRRSGLVDVNGKHQ
jgi:hypothetical protein